MVEWLTKGRYSFDKIPLSIDLGECDFEIINTSYPSNLLCSWGFVKDDSRNFCWNIAHKKKQNLEFWFHITR